MHWFSRFGAASKMAKLAPGKRIYAIGDVHGRNDLLCELLEQIRRHAAHARQAENILVLLGDYVDRGPQSKAVIDTLLGLYWPRWKFVFLRGNHDQAVLDFLKDANFYRGWCAYGAPETLLSYGVPPPRLDREAEFIAARDALAARIPKVHVGFLEALRLMHVEDDYLFVHAGIRPGVPIQEQSVEDLLWIRDSFLHCRTDLPKKVVHGHTQMDKPVIARHRISIDTGAYATGRLTAAILEEESCLFLQTSAETHEDFELARA
jgi:serine/threonine protein phosphatase 1